MDLNIDLALVLDLFGVFFFAVSGCMLAARKGIDLVGSLLLGSMAGLGGGVVRDLVIGTVPAAFSNPLYLIPPVLAAVLVYFLLSGVERLGKLLTLFDAGGLALFCMTGAVKALDAGLNPVSAALLGVTTAVGGGLLRDVVANEIPALFNPRDIYAIPAFIGSALTTAASLAGWFNSLVGVLIAAVVFALRVAALHFAWHAPLAVRSRNRSGPE
jgi:uncharacterized membrane protein YeiH